MSKLGEQAAALQEREDALRKELHQVLAEAGTHLLSKPETVQGADLAGIRKREQDVSNQIREVEASSERIASIEARLAEIKKRKRELNAEIKELSENLDPIYEEIGRLAFDVYRNNPLVDQQYAEIFTPLVEVHSELMGIDASIAEQQAILEEKPFLEKMVVRGRIGLLRNRRATREGSFRRLVRSAGRDIMGTAYVDEIGDPTLSKAAEPYRDRLKATRERETELEDLNGEHQRLHEELDGLDASKRPNRRLHELEEDLRTLGETRDVILVELAQAAANAPASSLPAKVKGLFKQSNELETKLSTLGNLKERVEAGLELESLEADTRRMQAEIEKKEARQAEIKQEISDLKRDRKSAEDRMTECREKRGAVDELLADDLLDQL